MRTLSTLAGILITSVFVFGQSPASTPPECSRNVSFAVTAGGQPVAAIPSFVAHSIGSEKHQERYPGLCFTQTPDPRKKNYVVVFSTQPDAFTGLVPSVLKYINSTPISENNALNTIYGEMWHYTSNQPAAPSTTTWDVLHTDTSAALFVRAYNEHGVVVSEVSLKDVSGWLHTKEKLVDRVLGDIRTDSRQLTAAQLSAKASLPVYYVNCDVPVESLTNRESAATPRPAPAPAAAPAALSPPPPSATLEFWSSPAEADVYLDGKLVGKTPSSVTVAPGDYTITMSKPNFGTWQRRLQVDAGKRRVGAFLEQKTLTLEFPPSASTPPVPRNDALSKAVMDIWSNPEGADILLDGAYVGKTPYSLAVSQGEHTVALRKKDVGTWQHKVVMDANPRRVGGNLEQRTGNYPLTVGMQ